MEEPLSNDLCRLISVQPYDLPGTVEDRSLPCRSGSADSVTFEPVMTPFANILQIVMIERDIRIVNVLFGQHDPMMDDISEFLLTFFTHSPVNHDPLTEI